MFWNNFHQTECTKFAQLYWANGAMRYKNKRFPMVRTVSETRTSMSARIWYGLLPAQSPKPTSAWHSVFPEGMNVWMRWERGWRNLWISRLGGKNGLIISLNSYKPLVWNQIKWKQNKNKTKPTHTYQGHLYNLQGTLLVKCHFKEGNIKQI